MYGVANTTVRRKRDVCGATVLQAISVFGVARHLLFPIIVNAFEPQGVFA